METAAGGQTMEPVDAVTLVEALKRENASLRSELARLKEATVRKRHVVRTKNELGSKMSHHVVSHQGKIGRRHMRGTASSIASAEILAGLFTPRETVPDKLLARLDDPSGNIAYFRGKQFALDLMALCEQAQGLFEKESRCLYVQSPCHVFGDIHGNLDDLHFFGENIWNKGIKLTPGRLLFLGDYVDRGMHSLECVAYLLSMKVKAPGKVFLLRGNHELRDVNSWEDYYGEGSFLWQCKDRFGHERGTFLWEVVNQVFDRLPLAAVVDNDIFCIHGKLTA
jgi:Calcineurin-like phosphoesterase